MNKLCLAGRENALFITNKFSESCDGKLINSALLNASLTNRRIHKYFLCLIIILIFGSSCSKSTSSANGSVQTAVIVENNKTIIVDQSGKRWDITDAVKKYGFKAEEFEFGVGPFAIPPIIKPQFVLPGEVGFPASTQDFLVIGTRIHNDSRAYPLYILKSREIVVESFQNTHVAIAY